MYYLEPRILEICINGTILSYMLFYVILFWSSYVA